MSAKVESIVLAGTLSLTVAGFYGLTSSEEAGSFNMIVDPFVSEAEKQAAREVIFPSETSTGYARRTIANFDKLKTDLDACSTQARKTYPDLNRACQTVADYEQNKPVYEQMLEERGITALKQKSAENLLKAKVILPTSAAASGLGFVASATAIVMLARRAKNWVAEKRMSSMQV